MRNVIIMAAGRGARMMPLTDKIPKAMAPYAGTTLIANGIDKIREQIANIYVTVGYKGSLLAKHVIEKGVSGVFNTEGQDNSWWIFNTLLKHLDEPLLVLTCDNVVDLDINLIYNEYRNFNNPACMVVPVKPISGLSGDFIFHDNNIVNLLSRDKESDIYCSGIQILNPYKINHLITNCSNFYEVWSQLIKIEQLYCGNTYPKKWFAVDTISQLQDINNQK